MDIKALERQRKAYTQGNWSPLTIRVCRELQKFPLIDGMIWFGPVSGGMLARKIGCNQSTVGRVKRMLELGVIPPTDNEVKEAAARGEDIPHRRFYPDFKLHDKDFAQVQEIPLEWKKVVEEDEAARTIKQPEPPIVHHDKVVDDDFVEEVTPTLIPPPHPLPQSPQAPLLPPPPPTENQAAVERNKMQQDIDKLMKDAGKQQGKPAEEVDPVAYLKKAMDEANKKPLTPSDKDWRKDKQPPAETPPPPAAEKPEKPVEEKKVPAQMIVGGDLFWNIQKVRVPLSTIIWYYYCQRVYAYQGDLSEFLEWCVNDCIEARGLSLEVVENPLGLISEGMKELHKGDGDGKT